QGEALNRAGRRRCVLAHASSVAAKQAQTPFSPLSTRRRLVSARPCRDPCALSRESPVRGRSLAMVIAGASEGGSAFARAFDLSLKLALPMRCNRFSLHSLRQAGRVAWTAKGSRRLRDRRRNVP